MDPHRNQRLTEALKEELTELFTLELTDPRLEGIVVTNVHVSPDNKHATIRIQIPGGQARLKEVLEAVVHAKPFFRRELADRIEVFRLPELRFEADTSIEDEQRMAYLLRKVRKGRPKDGLAPENSEKMTKA
ncbi:MAG: 30S ribosome-binding factor RbfA [Candidatus Solibacter usitatus]|nr:30S ribosome-binding factor RbfA [Candidatus Solibacter usitatus]